VKPILLDTGVIIALLDAHERHHYDSMELVTGSKRPLITCEAVISESCYLLRKLPGAAEVVLENVAAGVFQIPLQLSTVAADIRRLLHKYRDREIDLADACLVHLATVFETGDILTLDRDFQIYRWGRNNPFHTLVPLH
jgi:uncharacterized protein